MTNFCTKQGSLKNRRILSLTAMNHTNHFYFLIFCLLISGINIPVIAQQSVINGPLRVSERNPRYFTDNSGKAIYLTGSHTWNNLVDMTLRGSGGEFDFSSYLGWMKSYNHNFMRLWAWELLNWDTEGNQESKPERLRVAPHPWLRTGPGAALDGNPRFDLDRFDPAYFDRLRERVRMASEAGIYVSVMLFEGWGLQFSPRAYENHPFNPANNINGINGDHDQDGSGTEIHTLGDKTILSIQEAYVKNVIDHVNGFDNVLYEISNENHPPSTEWQYYMIDLIRDYEKELPKQHPVGMTFQYKGGSNKTLFDSPADWISPNNEGGYRDNPLPSDGAKVILNDTDHLWGLGGNTAWIWKSFMSGLNPLFMDPFDCRVLAGKCDTVWMESMRKGLGYSNTLANFVDLTPMIPAPDIATSGYCLANKGETYLVYVPGNKMVILNLEGTAGKYRGEWFNTGNGEFTKSGRIKAGKKVILKSPFNGIDGIYYLKNQQPDK